MSGLICNWENLMVLRKWLTKRLEIILFLISLFCLTMILAFGFGFYTAAHKEFPYFTITSVAHAVVEKYSFQLARLTASSKHEKYRSLWFPTNESTTGVVIHQHDKISPGLTFFSDNTTSAYLIDMDGQVIHKWHKPFYDVWPQPTHVKSHIPSPQEVMIHWRKAHLLPDGSVIAIYEGAFSPYGGGIIKIDYQSDLIWKVPVNAHHDLDIDSDGRIWVLTHKYNDQAEKPRIDDYLTVLSPDGRIIKEISLLQSVIDSPYQALLPSVLYGDYMHTNSVELLTEDNADSFPLLNSGDILLSNKNIGAITVLDRETFQVKWALTGVAQSFHAAHFLENGAIVFFNNRWRLFHSIRGSSLVEWDYINHQLAWEFTPIDYWTGIDPIFRGKDRFFSQFCGAQQQLPNGNYLVTETTGGSLFEITPHEEVVWKYVNTQFDGQSIGGMYWGQRFSKNDLPFLNNAHP